MDIEQALPFPSPAGVDPWWDVFLPALMGETSHAMAAMVRLEADTPARDRADLYAVSARTFYVLGRPVEARRTAEQAFSLGGAEAEALATMVLPDGPARAERRVETAPRAGLRADAACDLALLRLRDRDVEGARAAVRRALEACPDHVEAGRWATLLEEAPDARKLIRAAMEPLKPGRRTLPAQRDACDLVPLRRAGFVSTERLNRRVMGGPVQGGWAPAGTALGRLHDAGASAFHFATEAEYRRMPATDTLADLELLLEGVGVRVRAGRDARALAARLWVEAGAYDDVALGDAANALVGLGTQDPRLAPLGWDAADRQCAVYAGEPLWRAYRAWLGHLAARPEALDDARAVLADRRLHAASFTMAVATLRFGGRREEADAAIARALRDPALAAYARQARDRPDQRPWMEVGGRIAPRAASLPN